MINLKKDWLYPAKIVYGSFVIVQLFFLILGILLSEKPFPLAIASEFYQHVYQLSIIFILIYPLFTLKMLSPRRSNFFDAPLLTANLPYSKKELFWQSIKHWLYLAPLYLICQFGINYFLNIGLLGMDFNDFFYEKILNNLYLALILIAVVLQSIAAIIKCLADNVKWYFLLTSIVGGNILYIFTTAALLGRIGAIFLNAAPDINLLYIPIIILIFISLIICITSFNKIEKIWQ